MLSLILTIFGFLVGCESLIPSGNCSLPAKGPRKFPPNFSFGVATAAYQIEGSWNADGKGPSIWDDLVHNNPEKVEDGTNGDTAADSYRLFDLDLQALKYLKVNHYRFSISWPRIFPTGDISSRNQKGIDYYNMVINKLLANGIKPIVTIFHYDLPSEIQKLGGFTNALFIDYYLTYAEELFKNFGDRVKTWITFNEPMKFCKPGYGEGTFAPLVTSSGIGDYLCLTNILKSHAAAYHLYRGRYFPRQRGKMGMTLDSLYFYSHLNDTELIDRSLQYYLGIMAHAIHSKSGGFPKVLIDDIGRNSMREGRSKSRLPSLEGEWKKYIRGSADFLGINQYTSRIARRPLQPIGKNPSMDRDYDTEEIIDEKWLQAKSDWLHCIPEGMEDLLKYVRDEYDNVEVFVTETGWSDNGELNDDNRILYLKSYIQGVLNAINDGCNVVGYTYWSLIDTFEWIFGYT
ncbi:myrosinase 1-like [Episyrphus balteatus]|uniref:myrosinase 1-like n=1 Tax=Episyrphus balteatus TaxID=286459 RepID=UPI0024857F4F|nr:myrosinase 1-like [Episyrphus balteatus]